MVGPFATYGHEVVQACIASGCHYLDTTGEQDWVIDCDEYYGERMAEKGLLLAPGIAQMYTTGEIAAQIALETPGLDTLDILVFWKGFPTVASTRDDLRQCRALEGQLPRAEPVRRMARGRHDL